MRKIAAFAVALIVIAAWFVFDGAQRFGIDLRNAAYPDGAIGSVAGKAKAKNAAGAAGGKSIAVEVAQARSKRTSRDIPAIGTLQSDEAVQIAPEIAGRIAEILFLEGRPVKQGDLLVRLDDSLTQAEVTQARAQLTLAAANNERARVLARTGSVTDRSRDEAKAAYDSAEAALSLAETRLAKLVLKAPFDGVAGVRNVSVGAFIAAGTPIVNIEKIDRLKVDFSVPELFLQNVRAGQGIEVAVDAIAGRGFKGEIYAINPLIDVNGRALQIRARLDNREQLLRPGLFAKITIKGLEPREAVFVPESAIVPKGGQTYVFRVENGKAIEVPVQLGERLGAEVEVVSGLLADAVIVTAGQQKLRNGAAVEVLASDSNVQPVPAVGVERGSGGGNG